MGKILAGILGGIVVALLGTLVLRFASHGAITHVLLPVWAAVFVTSMIAKTGAKAWRYVFLELAILCFLAPISAMLFSGHEIAQQATGAGALGAGIAGGIFSIATGVGGFFLGIVFLVVGLLTGREKQVIVVQVAPPSSQSSQGGG